ncbi:MAG: zf-HC2 domain-containing protein [Pasteurellaceae bacterium]|nr:zf-HC2 domain-containing protein [Pasteurellaceae bacterium]
MKCIQVTKLISDSHERDLFYHEKIGVQLHLFICPHCRKFKQQCIQLSKLTKQFASGDKI